MGLFLDTTRFNHYDDELKSLSTKLSADLKDNEQKGLNEYRSIEERFEAGNYTGRAYGIEKERMKAERSQSYRNTEAIKNALYKSYWAEEKRLKDEKHNSPKAERPGLIEQSIAQYGSIKKANQTRLEAKYTEWQSKRSAMEGLGIATSSEILEKVNNTFAGLLTTADMRDGLIETLEKRARTLEHEKRGKEILDKQILKGMQIKARLINKNLGRSFTNPQLDGFMETRSRLGMGFDSVFETLFLS